MPQALAFPSPKKLIGINETLKKEINEKQSLADKFRILSDRNELILKSAGEGIYGLDINGNTTFANPAAEQMLGYKLSEMLNHTQHDLIHHTKKEGTPYDREDCKIYAALKDGVIHHVSDEVFWRKDGTSFSVEYFSTPQIKNGEIKGAVVTFQDITERKVSEEKLRLSEERFRTIFQEAPLGVALIDSITGHIYEVNNRFAEIEGRTREEMATIDWMSITHPDDVQEDLDNMADLNAGKISGFNMSKRYIKPEGSYVWINLTVAPIKIKDKGNPRHLAMIEDITDKVKTELELKKHKNHLEELVEERTKELKESQDKLHHSDKLASLGKLVGSVAHEFNNPLFGVTGIVDQLGGELSKEQREKLSSIGKKECWRMAGMIKNLQSFYKPSEGVESAIQMSKLVEDVLLIIGKDINRKGINILRNFSDDEVPIKAVEDQIKQVVINLLQNAADAISGPDGEIYLTLQPDSSNMTLKVQDNGEGIPEESIGKLFDPFFTTKGIKGTGLGLSVSYGIVKKHGGEISVESEPGKGSTFNLTLPAHN
ncbi:MAG: PAS domain S-box protein [Nitrospinota bacterium]